MILRLVRKELTENGIFSELLNENGRHICFVAEHAYDSLPKVPDGIWAVELGAHQLDHGGPQRLYCIQGIPGHEGICFHRGNYPQIDSDGCLLLGKEIVTANGVQMVTNSVEAFDSFMTLMAGISTFQLQVSTP